jgi:division protein CdvB (Snf7/Vps24/ESCRT-III family)
MSLKRDPSRPRINEEAAGILRAAAKVAEERIRKRFPEKRRVQ